MTSQTGQRVRCSTLAVHLDDSCFGRREYGLTVGHVESHYLPAHWQNRRQWLGDFGGLHVFLVDEYDIFVSKLSSKKKKHQLDLRVLALRLDRDKARQRLLVDGRAFLDDPGLRPQIEENWRFIFQKPLFEEQAEGVTNGGNPPSEESNRKTPRPKRPRNKRRAGD